jgi:hypothetical protein
VVAACTWLWTGCGCARPCLSATRQCPVKRSTAVVMIPVRTDLAALSYGLPLTAKIHLGSSQDFSRLPNASRPGDGLILAGCRHRSLLARWSGDRLAKVRLILIVSRKVFWCTVSSILTLFSMVPCESMRARAREGHEPRSSDARRVPARAGYPVAPATLHGSGSGVGVHVEHLVAERYGPLPLVCYARPPT